MKKINIKNNTGKGLSPALMVILAVCVLVAGIAIGMAVSKFSGKNTDSDGDGTGAADISTADEKYNVLDYVELGDYKELIISLAVTQEDIELEVESLQEEYTTYEQKKGVVQDGDMVYADFEGYVNGKKMEDTCGSDYIVIGDGDWIDGFEDSLIGARTGSQVTFTIPVPEGYYGDDSLDGKDVEFHVDVQYICGEEIVPEYTDEFVQSISSDYNTTEEYNAYLREKLMKENEADKSEYAWTNVLDICNVKEYPQDLMDIYEVTVLQGYYDMADIYGCTVDEVFDSFGYGSEENFKEEYLEEYTQDSVKEAMVADAIAKQEGISYSDDDYEAVVSEEYTYNSDTYDTQEAYEEANRQILKDMALISAVKTWMGENLTFTTEE